MCIIEKKLTLKNEDFFEVLGNSEKIADYDENLKKIFDETLSKYNPILNYHAILKRCSIEKTKNFNIIADKVLIIESKSISKLLKKSVEMYIFALTLGPEISLIIDEYFKSHNSSCAYLLDLIGSYAAEKGVEDICEIANQNIIGENKTLTRRFSPGYGDWKIECQHNLCEFVGCDKIGITVSDCGYLLPRKSVTGIIGIES